MDQKNKKAEKIKIIVGIGLICLVLVFVVQNMTLVGVRILFWTLSMSGALLFFLLIFVGAIFGWLLHGFHRRRKKAA